ncbi:glycosyltransferase [Reichenbachiella sp.]|uniref:glycosyltransferase n=1 Tax=Reichenbachiella sp. TaxID=2184521 RepID=UPI003BAF4F7F
MPSTTPLVTVCVITYNHAAYIQQALDSVLKQKTSFSWTILVADDCSTDGTDNILQRYKAEHPEKLQLILQNKNLGPAQNSIDLLSAPTTTYVAYLEGDDYWTDPNKLQKQVDFLENNPEYSFCFHNVDVVDSYNKSILNYGGQKSWYNQSFSRNELINGKFLFHSCSVVFRNQLALPDWFSKIPTGDKALQKLWGTKGKAYCFEDVMSSYRVHNNGISKTIDFFTNQKNKEKRILNELQMQHGILSEIKQWPEHQKQPVLDKIKWHTFQLKFVGKPMWERYKYLLINWHLFIKNYTSIFHKSRIYAFIKILAYLGDFPERVSKKLIHILYE